MRSFAIAATIAVIGSSAMAAGIDSRVYTCSQLQALIAARGFVYIGIPYQGFVVSGANFCAGDERLEPAGVVTSDNPQCTVAVCQARPGGFGGS